MRERILLRRSAAMRTRVILNPRAGGAEALAEIREALGRLPGAEVCETRGEGHGAELAREAVEDGVDLIVAAGGDGTLNEVLNGMAIGLPGVRLGVLPLGTGNDFVRSIGVPAGLDEAVAVLARGRTRRIDVARASAGETTRYFLNMAAGGFSNEVDEVLDSEVKRRWGPLAYIRSAAEAIPELTAHHARIVLDGGEELTADLYAIVVANARYVASGIPAAPSARLDDGALDVVIFREATPAQIAGLIPRALLGRHEDSEHVIWRRAQRVEVDSEPPIPFNADGEPIGETPAAFEILPRALEIVCGELVHEGEDGDRAEAVERGGGDTDGPEAAGPEVGGPAAARAGSGDGAQSGRAPS